MDPFVEIEIDRWSVREFDAGLFQGPRETAEDAFELRGVLLQGGKEALLAKLRTGEREVKCKKGVRV